MRAHKLLFYSTLLAVCCFLFLQCEGNDPTPVKEKTPITGEWECIDTIKYIGLGGPLEAERHVLTITEATFKYNFESEEIFAGEVLSTDSFTTNGTYTYGEDASLRFVSADTTMIGVVYDSKIILDTDSPYPNRKLQFEKRD